MGVFHREIGADQEGYDTLSVSSKRMSYSGAERKKEISWQEGPSCVV